MKRPRKNNILKEKLYRELNKEKLSERGRLFREVNKEKVIEYQTNYYIKNKDKLLVKVKS